MRNAKLLLFLTLGCVALFAVGLLVPWLCIPDSNNFGDTAGAVNGLFSALALAGVIYALLQQSHAIHHQRLELQRLRYLHAPELDKDRQITILLTFIDIRERLHRTQAALAAHGEEPDSRHPDIRALRARAAAITAEEADLKAQCRALGFDLETILKR
jgi:uncharacterized membrane protein YqjE